MLADDEQLLSKLQSHSISDPVNPSGGDIEQALDSSFKDETFGKGDISKHVGLSVVNLSVLLEGLKSYVNDKTKVAESAIGSNTTAMSEKTMLTEEALRTINRAIDLLGRELQRSNLSTEERLELRKQVVNLAEKACELIRKRDEHDDVVIRAITVVSEVTVAVLGIAAMIYTGGLSAPANRAKVVAGAKRALGRFVGVV
ncbi:MAG: hypothetical protein JO116_04230 [Planctomycetaceae bacterium]|nr:hypothetical protein [Planctomycetaceae bacterium]